MLGGGAANAMYSAMPADSIDAAMPDVPSTPVIQAGTLLETNQLYDLICTGNCNFEANGHLQFNVSYADRIPSLVTVGKTGGSKGKIVFDKPRPMATITLPGGHESYITISLEKLQGKSYADAAKYLALGVREKGSEDFIDILYMPSDDKTKNNPMICLQMAYYNIVELVPLVIENDMSADNAAHTPVAEGREVIGWGSIEEATRAFDFGTTFRVNIEEAEYAPMSDEPWVKMRGLFSPGATPYFCCANGLYLGHHGSAEEIKAYTNSTFSNIDKTAIFLVFFKGKYMAYKGFNNSPCSTSSDGVNWDDGSIAGSFSAFYKDGMCASITCATLENKLISVNKDGTFTASDDGITWNSYGSPLNFEELENPGKACSLCYGNKKLVAFTTEGYVFVSDNEGNNWDKQDLTQDLKDFRFLAFGNGKFLAANKNEKLFSSTDGKKWKDAGEIRPQEGYCCYGLGYDGNAFVAFLPSDVYRAIPLIPTSLLRE